MKRLLSVLMVILGVAGLGLGAGAVPSVAKEKLCPVRPANARTAVGLQVTGMSCATAHKVAARVVRRAPAGCVEVTDAQDHLRLRRPCVQLGYRCTGRAIAAGLALAVVCQHGERRVRFQY
jgi:hypothetical protein